MKLLKAYVGHTTNTAYTYETALEEYSRLTKQIAEQRQKTNTNGTTWLCWYCLSAYPASGFGANSTAACEIFDLRVKPGQWVTCIACKKAQNIKRRNPESIRSSHTCVICQIVKEGQDSEATADLSPM